MARAMMMTARVSFPKTVASENENNKAYADDERFE